jgi:hypothetical protein
MIIQKEEQLFTLFPAYTSGATAPDGKYAAKL